MDEDKAALEALEGISFLSMVAFVFFGVFCFFRRHELVYLPIAVNTVLGTLMFFTTFGMCRRRAIPARAIQPLMMGLGLYALATVSLNAHLGLHQGAHTRVMACMVAAGLCLRRKTWLAAYLLCSLAALASMPGGPYLPLFLYSLAIIGVFVSLAAHFSGRNSLQAMQALTTAQAHQNRALEETLEEAHRLGGSLDREVEERTLHLERTCQELSQTLRSQALLYEEKRRLQKEMEEGRRLESVGQAAGACAHDLNNILAILKCSLELLAELRPGGPGQDETARAMERAARVGRELLALSGHQILHRQPVSVATLAQEWGPTITGLLGESYRLEQVIEAPETRLVCDKQQLFLILAKLLVNATEAMPDGGPLRLCGRPCDDGHYLLELEDRGPGIPPELQAAVFEPFFTTRDAQEHAGLGLSTARACLRQHGGSIEVDSAPTGGAVVRLRLPVQPTPAGQP